MANRTPPRYVPTLTEVVKPADRRRRPPSPLPACRRSSSSHRVMQRVDLTLERRLREAIAATVLEQTALARAPAARRNRVGGARRPWSQAFADELAARQRTPK